MILIILQKNSFFLLIITFAVLEQTRFVACVPGLSLEPTSNMTGVLTFKRFVSPPTALDTDKKFADVPMFDGDVVAFPSEK